jgi:hypothetical protein
MASKPATPTWLEAVQRFERAIGEPIEEFVRSDTYFDLMTQAKRARARFTRVFEEVQEEWLHLFNLPAASDVRRLREQLGRVERRLDQVARDVADLEEEREILARASAARPARRRTNSRRRRTSATPKAGQSDADTKSSTAE